MLQRIKRWRVIPAVLALALAVWACEPVDPDDFDDPGLPDLENDLGDDFDDTGDVEP